MSRTKVEAQGRNLPTNKRLLRDLYREVGNAKKYLESCRRKGRRTERAWRTATLEEFDELLDLCRDQPPGFCRSDGWPHDAGPVEWDTIIATFDDVDALFFKRACVGVEESAWEVKHRAIQRKLRQYVATNRKPKNGAPAKPAKPLTEMLRQGEERGRFLTIFGIMLRWQNRELDALIWLLGSIMVEVAEKVDQQKRRRVRADNLTFLCDPDVPLDVQDLVSKINENPGAKILDCARQITREHVKKCPDAKKLANRFTADKRRGKITSR